jgi:hypothetical protein
VQVAQRVHDRGAGVMRRYRIVIAGMFEPVAHELRESGIVQIERSSLAHVFFRISGVAAGLARPTDDGSAVEVLLSDGTAGFAAERLVDQLRAHLQGYTVSSPVEQPRREASP